MRRPVLSAARRLTTGIVALACVLGVATLTGPLSAAPGPSSPHLQTAADTTMFRAGNIISDAVFYDSLAMNASQIQSFLNSKGASCRQAGGYLPCLKDYATGTTTQAPDSFCPNGYQGASSETAATIIAKVAVACQISPRVLLVTLQKETGLLTRSGTSLTQHIYDRAMGYGCTDSMNGGCLAYYPGLFRQLYAAAKQFQRYRANPTNYNFVPGVRNDIPWSTNAACGTGSVLIENQATAGLYNYTPYQPNAAALAAGYATGDGCSQYGNRNFWLYFTDWFGSTQTQGRDVDAPSGVLKTVTGQPGRMTVSGWAADPSAPTQAIQVHAYVDGVGKAVLVAGQPSADAATAMPAAGPNHGYSGDVPTAPGQHTVCTYGINVGAGYTNPLLGCQTVTVQDPALANPVGSFDSATVAGTEVTEKGWAFDPDAPTSALAVHVYVDGKPVTATTADVSRPDVAAVYPSAGDAHGFEWTGTVAPGSHRMCTYAINLAYGSGNPLLGCKAVTVAAAQGGVPQGSVDSVVASGTTVTASGWSFDPDAPTAPVQLHVYVDGTWAGALLGDEPRAAVAAAYPFAGAAHGYAWSATLPAGSHNVCVYAINTGAGSGNPLLGCKPVSVTAAGAVSLGQRPVGQVDGAAASATTVAVSGWTIDPDVPTTPLAVHLYVDGVVSAAVTADRSRPDVGTDNPIAGPDHGFTWSTTLAPGDHRICAYAINQGAGTGNPLLGCRSVTATSSPPGADHRPVGDLGSVTVTGTTVATAGWTFDPDVPTSGVMVHIYLDGRWTAAVYASQNRPDVGIAFPAAGPAHGFQWQSALTPGAHSICAFAINQQAGTANPLLRCVSVQVG